ncbi:MAG: glycosyltransferase family 1 protein [Patescibacteria group bacterium]
MRILIDIRLLGKGGQSGIEEYTKQIVSRLIKNTSFDFRLFYSGWRKAPIGEIWKSDFCWKSDFPASLISWPIPNKIFGGASRFFRWPKIDRLIKTDLIYSPHLNLLRHTKKTPRILTIHDLSFIHHPYFFSHRHNIWHWMQDIKQQAKQAAKIITVSQYAKNDIVETLGVSEKKVEVIYPAVRKSDFQQKSDFQKLQPYILYLGTIEPRKNIQTIIKAFDLLKKLLSMSDIDNLKLVIAGKKGWLYEDVERAYQQSPFKEDIIFTGAVSDEDKAALYRSAEAFVFPSFFEGFGLPPLEAQAHNCPVIASNRTSLPEILGDSALFVDPWKPQELAEKIKIVIENNELKNKLIAAGLENVKRFNWDKATEKLCAIFSQY